MKSKSTAYLLWFFLGALGIHQFYLGKTGKGVLYIFTLGLFGIGLLIDLFTLGSQVDTYNALYLAKTNGPGNNNNVNNIIVNVPQHAATEHPKPIDIGEQLHKLADLKEKGLLSEDEFTAQKSKLLS